jgi:hypothetical protein
MMTFNSGAARALSQTASPRIVSTCERKSAHTILYTGVKNMLRCDEALVVQSIADYVVSQHRGLRLLAALIKQTRGTPIPGVIALVGWLKAFLSVRTPQRPGRYAWISRLSNERRAIEAFQSYDRQSDWTELKFSALPDVAALRSLARNFAPGRMFRLLRRLQRRHEFFKILRVVELIAYYTRYLEIFRKHRFNLAVTSNHSNPHGIALNLAARKAGMPVVLVTHGMPIRPVARLSYELAIVHCETARETYLEEGCAITRALAHGRRQYYLPMPAGRMPQNLTVGIFLCKEVNEIRLGNLVARLLSQSDVSRILIRPHPKNLWRGLHWITRLDSGRVGISVGQPVFRDAQSVDLVLAGNSSVLVDAVTAGRPSGYVSGLDYGPFDLHQFVECGLIYSIEDNSEWNPAAMLTFYQRPEWLRVLRMFANIDENEADVAARGLEIMSELAAGK